MQSQNEFSVRINKLKLEEAGIPVIIFDQRDSSYNGFGYVYLKVHERDVEKSLHLINQADE